MDFCCSIVRAYARDFLRRLFLSRLHQECSFGRVDRSGLLLGVLMLADVLSVSAMAQGDATKGAAQWDYLCDHCHGTPQPNDPDAFRAYGKTANPLSLYASNPAAITKAINEGYIIPKGNTNDDYPPGERTSAAMNSFVGMGTKQMGVGETPSQYAIDISAYLATYFDEPGVPTINSVSAGNGQATISFSAPKSDLPITSYAVTANPGGVVATGNRSPIIVQGLNNGVAYTFTVKAASNAGTGKPSSASNAVTPAGAQQAAMVKPSAQSAALVAPGQAVPQPSVVAAIPAARLTLPNQKTEPPKPTGNAAVTATTTFPAPVIIAAKPGSTSARVFFTMPKETIPMISSYIVAVYKNGVATNLRVTGAASPIAVGGLANGEEYSFTVTAVSKTGEKATSVASNGVTPLGIFGD